MSIEPLIKLTKGVRDNLLPVFSILISRNGRLVYELYTSYIDPDDAHYVMSVTKSVLSAVVGIAIDRKWIRDADVSVTELLPRKLFPNDEAVKQLEPLTLRRVMGMSALDAPDPPRTRDPDTMAKFHRFIHAPNRVANVLERPLLPESVAFQYNDSNPMLVAGALQYATGKTVFELAEENLFLPLGFRNYEWMHQDETGIDMGGYGLRLRPIDMQKLGILYLQKGIWNGRRIISEAWIDKSFEPWNRSTPNETRPDYGFFWWTDDDYGPGFRVHIAQGWKGQRIAVFPEQRIVVTMTGCFDNATDNAFFQQLIKAVVIPSVRGSAPEPPVTAPAEGSAEELAAVLGQVRDGRARYGLRTESRMWPQKSAKESRRPFKDKP